MGNELQPQNLQPQHLQPQHLQLQNLPKSDAIVLLNKYANIIEVIDRYKISMEDIKNFIINKDICITTAKVTINASKTSEKWKDLKSHASQIILNKLRQSDTGHIIKSLTKIADEISESIVSQLKYKYDQQGIFNYLNFPTVSESFYYSDTSKIKDETYNRAEYLEITGNGTISCGQSWIYENNLELNINITIKAVSVQLDAVERRKGLPANTLLNILTWK